MSVLHSETDVSSDYHKVPSWSITEFTGRLPRGARQNSSLPHKCGVPQPGGTPHLCGRTGARRNLSCAHFQVFGWGVFCSQHQRCVMNEYLRYRPGRDLPRWNDNGSTLSRTLDDRMMSPEIAALLFTPYFPP